jgi:cytochrome P450
MNSPAMYLYVSYFSFIHRTDTSWTFYVAGMETTSRAVEFALYALAAYPQFQKRFQDEIDQYKASIGGKSVSEWSYSEAKGFIYATAIMVSIRPISMDFLVFDTSI